MPFTILQNSLTADATDINANFYHVAQGSRLPMGGNSLEATDSVYDLGSSIATWNNLFCENIYINNTITTVDKSLWVLEAEVTLSATASSIEFTGLNGDNDSEYRIIGLLKPIGANDIRFYLNSDSATNNYGQQVITGVSTAVVATRSTSITGFGFGGGSSQTIFINVNIKANNLIKMVLYSLLNLESSTTVSSISDAAAVWNNSATLTSMKLLCTTLNNFNPTTNIQLWKRG